ncbi:MAG: LytR family transcriptional regulator [Arthrospira sp. PLM2.Bin9]|nr:LCP family protein [Arthrospira sp. PLM2.Bin9]TVU54301.1 MAG: LytR family transcriptional regulator [Arthrospira sp. PLM2.Bin9]
MSYPTTNQRQPKVLRVIFLSFIALIITSASATLGALTALLSPLKPEQPQNSSMVLNSLWRDRFRFRLSRPVNILVMGIDPPLPNQEEDGAIFGGRSDSMILVNFNPSDRHLNLLSIPRDTEVFIPGMGVGKINEANYWGGASLATEVVADTLNKVQINRYVRVSTGAFKELVNLLGGVEVFVPYPMSYRDNTQQLEIDLSPGWQTIDGDQADHFARFRSDAYGDIGRIQRQQALMEAIRERLQSPDVLRRIPQIIRVMLKYVDTNLDFEEMLTLVKFGLNLEPQQVRMVMLPGRDMGGYTSYWVVDDAARDRIMAQYFRVDSTGFVLPGPMERSGYQELSKRIKIAVQNASGNPQAAERVADYLFKQGFNNVYVVPGLPYTMRSTQIIVQGGDLASAELLQEHIGFGTVRASSTGAINSDFTIRVGDDWQQRF